MGVTRSAGSILKIRDSTMQVFIFTLLSLLSLASADHAPGYGGYGITCRNTTNTYTGEICVPAFAETATPITLAVKEVQDNDYCYDQIRTVCTATETTNQHELCTYSYAPKTETLPAQVTQVTYEEKSETMKVTNCKATGYGGGYGRRLHVSPYFDTAKRLTGPLMVEQPQPQRSEVPKSRMNRDLDTVLQENMDLAEEILFDLKSLLKNDGRPGRSTRMLQDMVEIDPDDPKD